MQFADVLSITALYTPALQAVLLYAYCYRGEPFRFLHPLREKKGIGAWVDVLTQLGLIKEGVETHERGKVERVRRLIKLLMPSALLSLLCAYVLVPVLMGLFPILARFESPLLFFVQFIPAIYFFLLSQRDYLGPPPLEPRRHTLPTEHRSSLIRHLEEL